MKLKIPALQVTKGVQLAKKIHDFGNAARLGLYSSNREKEQFKRLVSKAKCKYAYDVMWGNKYGVKQIGESFMSHLRETFETSENVQESVWGQWAQDSVGTFYRISATNLVTTGSQLIAEMETGIGDDPHIRKLAKSFFNKFHGTELCLHKYIMPFRPYNESTCERQGHRFITKREENTTKQLCIKCSRESMEKQRKIKSALMLRDERDRNGFFGIGKTGSHQTTTLDSTAKRDIGFIFYFLEPRDQSREVILLKTRRYGCIYGTRGVEMPRNHKIALVQTHDLVTPELHGLSPRDFKKVDIAPRHEEVYGPKIGKDITNDMNKIEAMVQGVVTNIRELSTFDFKQHKNVPAQRLKTRTIKRYGFVYHLGKKKVQIMPLELLFIWPHMATGLALRAWLDFFRLDNHNKEKLSFVVNNTKKFFGQFFRIQFLIPGETTYSKHRWSTIL